MSATALKSAAAIALAAFAVSAAPAGAAHSAALDLPLSATPCKLDTSPSYPSCGTAPQLVAIAVPEPVFTATPCRLDTSPSYPSCGTSPR